MRVIANPILRAKLAVNAIENPIEIRGLIREEHSPSGSLGYRLDRMLTRGVPAALVFYRPNPKRIEQGLRLQRCAPGVIEISAAGGFTGVGNQDNHAAPIRVASGKSLRGKQHRVVERCSGVLLDTAHGRLQDR